MDIVEKYKDQIGSVYRVEAGDESYCNLYNTTWDNIPGHLTGDVRSYVLPEKYRDLYIRGFVPELGSYYTVVHKFDINTFVALSCPDKKHIFVIYRH